MQDTVLFQGQTYSLPSGFNQAEIVGALSEQAPAITNAAVTVTENADGSKTWDFAERAGTKG